MSGEGLNREAAELPVVEIGEGSGNSDLRSDLVFSLVPLGRERAGEILAVWDRAAEALVGPSWELLARELAEEIAAEQTTMSPMTVTADDIIAEFLERHTVHSEAE